MDVSEDFKFFPSEMEGYKNCWTKVWNRLNEFIFSNFFR